MIRAIFLLASAAATGVALGRSALSSELDRQKQKVVEEAALAARDQIKRHARSYLIERSRQVGLNFLLKLAVVCALLIAYAVGLLPGELFVITASAALSILFVRDAVVAWPTLRLALAELRRHRWQPRKAISELVAAPVFDRVLSEAAARPVGRTQKVMLHLAGESKDEFVNQIARAVSDIAAQTGWSDVRPFVIWAVINYAVFLAFYAGFIALAFRALS